MRAAAKRRSQAELGCGAGPRCVVYGALAGRSPAERRLGLGLVDENQKLLLLGSPVEWELAVEL